MKYIYLPLLFFMCLTKLCIAQTDSAALKKSVSDTTIIQKDSVGNGAVNNETSLIDTTKKSKVKKVKEPYMRQFRISADIVKIPLNIAQPSKQGYEIQLDYLLRNNLYAAAETGFGRGNIDYSFLKYSSNSYFLKFGVDKSILDVVSAQDFDIAFIGVRYGAGFVRRNEATYIVQNPFGGELTGTVPAKNNFAHWFELNAGFKVAIFPSVFIGYNVRMRFLLNAGAFNELAPSYIAGYGRADASASFDFNGYIGWAIRWKK